MWLYGKEVSHIIPRTMSQHPCIMHVLANGLAICHYYKTGLLRKAYIMATKKRTGLQLTIELDADEAEVFRRLSRTNDSTRYAGIAKSLVLGAQTVAVPEQVCDDIDLINAVADYGKQSEKRADQHLADTLSITRAQLEMSTVRAAIKYWTVFFSSEILELSCSRNIPYTDQAHWARLNVMATSMLDKLRAAIRSSP